VSILDAIRSGKQQAEEFIDEKARYFLGPHGYNAASGIMRLVPELSDAADVRDYFTYGGQLGEKLKEGQLDSSTFQDALDTTGSGLAMLIPGLSYRTLKEGTRTLSPPDSGSGGGEPLSKGEIVTPTKPIVSDIDPLGFYSKALRSLGNIKKDTGTGEEFLSLLKKAGVKDEELKYSGLGSLLKDDKVVKEELIEKASENLKNTRIEEVVKSKPSGDYTDFRESIHKTSSERALIGFAKSGSFNHIEADKAVKQAIKDGRLTNTVSFDQYFGEGVLDRFAKIKDESPISTYDYDTAIKKMLSDYYENPVQIYEDALSGVVIKGSEGYGYNIYRNRQEALADVARIDELREGNVVGLRSAMPGVRALNDNLISDLEEAEIQARDFVGGTQLGSVVEFSEYTLMPNNNYREFVLTLPTEGGSKLSNEPLPKFKGHYKENAFSHYRTNDIELPNGERSLFIEEVQSDWAQKGRKLGFKLTEDQRQNLLKNLKGAHDDYVSEISKFTVLQDGKQVPFFDFYNTLDGTARGTAIKESVGKEASNLDPSRLEIADIQYNFMKKIMEEKVFLDGKPYNPPIHMGPREVSSMPFVLFRKAEEIADPLGNKIEQAPFVTDQNYDRNWLAVSLRRILNRAVDEGYEYVSFPTGTSGDFSQNYFARSDKGLQNFYEAILPNTLKKIVRKFDEDAIIKADDSVYDDIPNYIKGGQPRHKGDQIFSDATNIRITPKLIEALEKGIPVFAEGGLVGLEHIAKNMFRGPQGIDTFQQFIAKPQRPMVG